MPTSERNRRAADLNCRAEKEALDNDTRTYACWCNEASERGWLCTRIPGHKGVHVCGNAPGEIFDRWGWVK